MPGENKNLERMLVDLLDVKNKHNLDNDGFMVLLGLINLMGIINLMEDRAALGKKESGARRAAPEKVPFMNMFAGPRGGGHQSEEEGK
ncbi:MAG: hypothetical protein VR67_10305 [Peptococcaceae bacterium BRH_c8a]|nr:MAG: hypothetical protein VR67_10305 [Peptococcaceae bacterium BRH_c8a]